MTCPAGNITAITATARGGRASFRPGAPACPLRPACTAARRGRTITIHPLEHVLQRARQAQREPAWQERYRAERPIVERKISHFTRRAWGGREARTRGLARISTDLYARAAPSTGPGSPSSAPATTEPAGQSSEPENRATRPSTIDHRQATPPSTSGTRKATASDPQPSPATPDSQLAVDPQAEAYFSTVLGLDRRPRPRGAENHPLPHPARRRQAGPQRPAPPPENPRHLALGSRHRRSLDPHPGPPASPLTSAKAVPALTKKRPGPVEPRHPARQPGHRHTPDPESAPATPLRQHPSRHTHTRMIRLALTGT